LAKKIEHKNIIKESNYSKFVLIGVLVLVLGYFLINNFLVDKNKKVVTTNTTPKTDVPEPQFKKQGELKFLSSNGKKELRMIDIEIAANDSSRTMGLMYRKSMEETKGMLFIFEQPDLHSFWMKNTYISLDIIYVSEKKEIVKIYKNTEKLSTKSLPTDKPSLYVVEVIAGFCEKYGIKEGDKIEFSKM
jgi:uncharacterized protein